MAFDFIVLLLGLSYGYFNPGKEHKTKLIKNGLKIGVILGIIISLFFGGGLLVATATTLGIIIAVGYLAVMFAVGAWIGDWLEIKFKKKPAKRRKKRKKRRRR